MVTELHEGGHFGIPFGALLSAWYNSDQPSNPLLNIHDK